MSEIGNRRAEGFSIRGIRGIEQSGRLAPARRSSSIHICIYVLDMHSMPHHHQEVYVQAGTFEPSIWPITIFDSDFESNIIANIGNQCPTTKKCMLLGGRICARKAFCAKASPCKKKCTPRVHPEFWGQQHHFFS